MLLCLLGGCRQQPAPDTPPETAVDQPPQRIVSLLPSLTELLFAIGAGEQVVAVTANDDYPPQVAHLPRVGDMTIDYERLLQLKPDLVVLDPGVNPDYSRLQELGIAVEAVRVGSLAELSTAITQVGQRAGRADQAARVRRDFEQRLTRLRQAGQALNTSPTVLIELQATPLITAGGDTLVGELLEVAGGHNIFAESQGFPAVSEEQVLSRQPDFVVLTTLTLEQAEAHPLLGRLRPQPRFLVLPPNTFVRPTTRVLDSVEKLTKAFDQND